MNVMLALLATVGSADSNATPTFQLATPSATIARPRPLWSPGEVPYDATVVEENTLVYEEPSVVGKVLRRVFVGEILRVVGEVDGVDGRHWSEVVLGSEQDGFVETTRIGRGDRLPRTGVRVVRVLREERPIALATRALGEALGPALTVRYHPFSRIGLAAAYGVPVGGGGKVGLEADDKAHLLAARFYSIGLVSALVLDDLSPVVEVGIGRFEVRKGNATLNLTTIDFSLGIEWMTKVGVFVGTGVAYVRSIGSYVSFDYADLRESVPEVPEFSGFDPGPNDLFQAVSPSLTMGYAF